MLERRWLGDKTRQGFYKKEKDAEGKELRLALDWKTLEYRPADAAQTSLAGTGQERRIAARASPPALGRRYSEGQSAAFQWQLLSRLFAYAADCLPEIADEPASIDRAMRTGFNWELGPFEMWDAVGVATPSPACAGGQPAIPNAETLLRSGASTWYRDDPQASRSSIPSGGVCSHPPAGGHRHRRRLPQIPWHRQRQFRSFAGRSRRRHCRHRVAFEEGRVGEDITRLVTQTLNPGSDAVRDFQGFVITGDGANFSVGANLLQVLLFIQEGEWDDLDFAVRAFQRMTAAIRFCPRPVVVAPFGLCLGGGAEIALHAASRQPHAELYMGLVETGVGVVPGGGGTKEMVLRAVDSAAAILSAAGRDAAARLAGSTEYFDALKRNFELIGMAKVSTSAADARLLGYLSPSDRITAIAIACCTTRARLP